MTSEFIDDGEKITCSRDITPDERVRLVREILAEKGVASTVHTPRSVWYGTRVVDDSTCVPSDSWQHPTSRVQSAEEG